MQSEESESTEKVLSATLEAHRAEAESIREQAMVADDQFAFEEAFRLFTLAAFEFADAHMEDDADLCLMRAATALEKTED